MYFGPPMGAIGCKGHLDVWLAIVFLFFRYKQNKNYNFTIMVLLKKLYNNKINDFKYKKYKNIH